MAWERVDDGADRGIVVANLGGYLDRPSQFLIAPIGLGEEAVVAQKIVVVADDDTLPGRINVDDVDGTAMAAAKALALADGVEFNALVVAHEGAVLEIDAAGVKILFSEVRFEERGVVIAGNEADFLAVFLVVGFEAHLFRNRPDFRLGQAAKGEDGAGQLLLPQAEEEIGLVLAFINGAQESGTAFSLMFDAGVMAGGDVGRAERAGLGQEIAKLELFVAHDTRVGGASGAVFAGEVIDDHFLKLIRLVDDIVGNAERVGDATRIGHGLGAAAFILSARDAILGPDLHGDADHIVALLLEEVGRNGGIDAAAHAEQDAGGRGR